MNSSTIEQLKYGLHGVHVARNLVCAVVRFCCSFSVCLYLREATVGMSQSEIGAASGVHVGPSGS